MGFKILFLVRMDDKMVWYDGVWVDVVGVLVFYYVIIFVFW